VLLGPLADATSITTAFLAAAALPGAVLLVLWTMARRTA
jgi:hypothetical protein